MRLWRTNNHSAGKLHGLWMEKRTPKKIHQRALDGKKRVDGCVCGKKDCLVPFGFCHCGCGKPTKIAKSSSRIYKTRSGYPNAYLPSHARRLNSSDACVCGDPACTIPYGKCHCGCGNNTSLAKQGDSKRNLRVGKPVLFIARHHRRYKPIIEAAIPFKIDNVYCRLIPLTRGLHAIVDASDYEWLSQYKWSALKGDSGYYAFRTEFKNGKRLYTPMHRVILGLNHDDPLLGDHINRVSLDNRRKNLRPATHSQNQFNSVNKGTASGRKGVNWSKRKKKYIARICANRMMIDLGSSDSFEEACRLREEGERLYHGQFACAD